jgi:hypothetical protein
MRSTSFEEFWNPFSHIDYMQSSGSNAGQWGVSGKSYSIAIRVTHKTSASDMNCEKLKWQGSGDNDNLGL